MNGPGSPPKLQKDDAKVQADKTLAELREERAEAGRKYDALKQSTKDAWQDTKAAFQSAWDKLEKGFDDTRRPDSNKP